MSYIILVYKRVQYDPDKNEKLKKQRNVSFEDLFDCEEKYILADIENENPRYPGQRIIVAEIKGYTYMIPYVKNEDSIFLKTMIPSRKFRRIFRGDE
jgi:hypothetical protein